MNIGKKLEEIRNKPEHIRERYLWVSVGLCMLIIFGIWIISFKTSFNNTSEDEKTQHLKESINEAKEQIENSKKTEDIK